MSHDSGLSHGVLLEGTKLMRCPIEARSPVDECSRHRPSLYVFAPIAGALIALGVMLFPSAVEEQVHLRGSIADGLLQVALDHARRTIRGTMVEPASGAQEATAATFAGVMIVLRDQKAIFKGKISDVDERHNNDARNIIRIETELRRRIDALEAKMDSVYFESGDNEPLKTGSGEENKKCRERWSANSDCLGYRSFRYDQQQAHETVRESLGRIADVLEEVQADVRGK